MATYNYWPRYGIENYSVILPMEQSFDSVKSTVWMQENWYHSVILSAVYVAAIFAGQKVIPFQPHY